MHFAGSGGRFWLLIDQGLGNDGRLFNIVRIFNHMVPRQFGIAYYINRVSHAPVNDCKTKFTNTFISVRIVSER